MVLGCYTEPVSGEGGDPWFSVKLIMERVNCGPMQCTCMVKVVTHTLVW